MVNLATSKHLMMGLIKKKKLKLPFRLKPIKEIVEYKPELNPDGSEYTLLELMQKSATVFNNSNLLRKRIAIDYFKKENKDFYEKIHHSLLEPKGNKFLDYHFILMNKWSN